MNKKTFSAMFTLAALFAVFLGGIGLSATTYTINNPANWPVWPQKSTSTVLLDPVTSISIGREALAWMFFEDRLSAGLSSTHFSDTFFKGSLITMVQVDPASADFSPATNVFASDNIFFTLPSGDLSNLDLSSTHFAQLAARSVLKVQDPNWATVTTNGNSQSVTNQMLDGTRIDSSWLDFLKANWTTGAFNLADSGHAAPLLVWKDNNWLIRFVGDYAETASTDLSAWNNKIALFQPTNQGMLYTFYLQKGTSPTLNLSSGVMPPQSFVTAPYQYLQRTYDGNKYSRFTSLGGPVTVFDTEKSNNQWRRLLVGTTGVGTSFMNKPSDAWKKLSESTISSFSPPSGLTLSSGRLTGVYAIDVTNPSAPRGLWSITKTFFNRTTPSYSLPKTISYDRPAGVSALSEADQTLYKEMNYLTAKPIIGYYNTENEGRKWLVVAITVTDDNQYRWYQIDARDGKIVSSDVFPDESAPSLTNRPLTGISGNVETIFPSRILYAYPRYPSNYNNEPVLSDVYVYLSNGSIYDWNIQDQQDPRKIARIFTNTDNFVPPAADFDITYMDGRRFISALVYFNHNNLAQSVYGLILGDLDQILEREDRLNINLTSFGWGGNVFATGGSGLAGIQLEYFKQSNPGGGAVAPNFTAVSSPVFVEGKLYLPVFVSVTQQQGGLGTVRLTRLYQIPDIAELISGKTLVAGEDYIDIPAEVDGELVANMILDPEGRLLLLDSEGNVIKTIDTNLTFAGGNVGGPGESIPGIKIKYWKIRS